MSMVRSDRYELRGILKENANRHNSIWATHPQARRGIEEAGAQEVDWERTQGSRKAKRNRRILPPLAIPDDWETLPEVDDMFFYRFRSSQKGIGGDQCIAEGRHVLVREPIGQGFIYNLVGCERCGTHEPRKNPT